MKKINKFTGLILFCLLAVFLLSAGCASLNNMMGLLPKGLTETDLTDSDSTDTEGIVPGARVTIMGVLLNEFGEGVPLARVEMYKESRLGRVPTENHYVNDTTADYSVKSDMNGVFVLPEVDSAYYFLQALGSSANVITRPHLLISDTDVNLGPLVMSRTGTVKGQFFMPDKTSHDGIRISLVNRSIIGHTNGSGQVRMEYIPVGVFDFYVEKEGYFPLVLADVTVNAGQSTELGVYQLHPVSSRAIVWHSGYGMPSADIGSNEDYYFNTQSGDIYVKDVKSWILVTSTGHASAQWLVGEEIPAITMGNNGDYYYETLTAFVYRKTYGKWKKQMVLEGQQGDQGTAGEMGPAGGDGRSWHHGDNWPSVAVGVHDDFYLNYSNGDVFLKNEAGVPTWNLITNIMGRSGEQGPTGPQGPQGPEGEKGEPEIATATITAVYLDSNERTMTLTLDITRPQYAAGYLAYYYQNAADYGEAGVALFRDGVSTTLTNVPVVLPQTIINEQTYYIRVSIVDSSGNEGPRSRPIEVTLYNRPMTDAITIYEENAFDSHVFPNPYGIVVDSSGWIVVADRDDHQLSRFDPNNLDNIEIYGDYDTADDNTGGFDAPHEIGISSDDWVVVADYYSNRVVRVKLSDFTGTFEYFHSDHFIPAGGDIYRPRGAVMDTDGYIYVSDDDHQLKRFHPDDPVNTYEEFGSYSSAYNSGGFHHPWGMVVDSQGRIILADHSHHQIVRFDPNNFPYGYETFGRHGTDWGQFHYPVGVCVDSQDRIYVGDRNNDRVVRFDPADFEGTFTVIGNPGTAAGEFNQPRGVALLNDHTLFVTDGANDRVQRLVLQTEEKQISEE